MTRTTLLLLVGAVAACVPCATGSDAAASESRGLKERTSPNDPGTSGVGTVLIAQTVDAEVTEFDPHIFQQDLNLRSYQPGGWGYILYVMSPTFRNANRDSYGNSMKITWFLLSGEPFCQSLQHDCAIVHTCMEKYRTELAANGDMIGWHYHNWGWTNDGGDGTYGWNELLSFNGRATSTLSDRELAEKALAYLVIEKHTYPTVFRSGWTWENNDFSLWLDDIVPFDFSNLSPLSNAKIVGTGPRSNLFDWKNGPVSWTPYHPAADDYQQAGNLKRWQFHSSNEMKELSGAFRAADSGGVVLVTHYTHSYDSYGELDYNWRFQALKGLYPRVKFRYVTALEGARMILGLTDTIPPLITVAREGSTITVTSNEPLFSFPYAAVRDNAGYHRLLPQEPVASVKNNTYSWSYRLEQRSETSADPASSVIAFGGCDPAGNSFVTSLYPY